LTDTVNGVRVLDRGRSGDPNFPWVVLCEVPNTREETSECFVVWYEDPRGRRSVGYYTSARDDAEAEFERRTRGRGASSRFGRPQG
jgi:hypothetical protein